MATYITPSSPDADDHALVMTGDELRVIARALDHVDRHLCINDTDRALVRRLLAVIGPPAHDLILADTIARREAKKD